MNLLRKISFFAGAVAFAFVGAFAGVVKTSSGNSITTSGGMPVMVGDADVTKGMKGMMMNKDMDMSKNSMRTSNDMMMDKGVMMSKGMSDSNMMKGSKKMMSSNNMMKDSKEMMRSDAMMSSHKLFFAFNSTKISKVELNKLLSSVASLKAARSIVVVGHTDAKGSDYANHSVSKRRAEAVKALLGRLGVDTRKVMVKAKGAKEPMVRTAKGMREARNRRVEIMPVM